MSVPRLVSVVPAPPSQPLPTAQSADAGSTRATQLPDAWTIAEWLAAAITLAGLAHVIPLWIPLQLRDPDAVIVVATHAADAYPTLLLGIFLLISSFAARSRWRALAVLGSCLAALAIVVLGSALVYAATALGMMHELASGAPEALAAFRLTVARTLWFHGVVGAASVAGGVGAVELARHYRLRQRV